MTRLQSTDLVTELLLRVSEEIPERVHNLQDMLWLVRKNQSDQLKGTGRQQRPKTKCRKLPSSAVEAVWARSALSNLRRTWVQNVLFLILNIIVID